MKNIKSVLTVALFLVTSALFAQSSANGNIQQTQTSGAASVQTKKPYTTPPINEDDPYMGRTDEFLYVMVVDKLPEDFPKYEKSMGLREYNRIVDSYYASHLHLLKDRWKEKVSGGQH